MTNKHNYHSEFLKYKEAGDTAQSMSKEEIKRITEEIKTLGGNTSKTDLKARFDIQDEVSLLLYSRDYCDATFGPGSYRNMSNGKMGHVLVAAVILSGNLERVMSSIRRKDAAQGLALQVSQEKQGDKQASEAAGS